jgi:hypothetical protein
LAKIVVKDFAPKSVLAMVFATTGNAHACQDGVALRVMLVNAQRTTLRWYVRVMAIVKMVNVNATIVLSDQIVRPMLVQWVAFMVPVPTKANVCATMVFEVSWCSSGFEMLRCGMSKIVYFFLLVLHMLWGEKNKKSYLFCIFFLNSIQVPIVPYQGALDIAMATVCAVVPSVFAVRALPVMIAVRCLAVTKKIRKHRPVKCPIPPLTVVPGMANVQLVVVCAMHLLEVTIVRTKPVPI